MIVREDDSRSSPHHVELASIHDDRISVTISLEQYIAMVVYHIHCLKGLQTDTIFLCAYLLHRTL